MLTALGIDEVGERVADDLLDAAANALRAVLVDGEDRAVEIVRADHAERAFDELAVARFALADGGFRDALHGDVDAGGDDEGDLALGVDQRGCRPGDAAARAVGGDPEVFVGGGELASADALEVLDVLPRRLLRG